MAENRLYKYLDVNGGLAMLEHHNLQFTNATQLNDPFDCPPALFDYSNVSKNQKNVLKHFDYYNVTIERPLRLRCQFNALKIDELLYDKGEKDLSLWLYEYFYKPAPLRTLEENERDILELDCKSQGFIQPLFENL